VGGDVIIAGEGRDVVTGNPGTDTVFLGDGNDLFNWDPGDSSDVVEGQFGVDEMLFNGSNANENINILANGGRVSFLRDVAAVTMDLNDVEAITYAAIGGTDNITVGNLAGTDITKFVIDLAGFEGGSDGAADTVTVNGTPGAESLTLTSTSPGIIAVDGLAWLVKLQTFGGQDTLSIAAGGGDDIVDASALQPGVGLFVHGGDGNDVITGGAGADTLTGGAGIDGFVYTGHADSNTTGYDAVTDFAAGTDDFHMDVAVTGIDAAVNGNVSAASFGNDLDALADGNLLKSHAMLINATGGTLSGRVFLLIDANNTKGFQKNFDYVIDVTGITGTLTTADFIS
jgi:Ca2+-binding RTX toxin-like protein